MGRDDEAEPLDQAHYSVYGSSHVVRGEPPDERIECGRSWADAEEKRDFDKDEHKAGEAATQY